MRFAVALACCLAFSAQAAPENADTEIHYLLDFVAASQCTFVRNGTEHSSVDAADHLRLKYSRGGRYATTAEGFIDNLATESSWSGEPYRVTCGGKTEPTSRWLHRALAGHRGAAD
jgi:hypothetical protein